MYYAGIDIAKLNHFAAVVSSESEVLVQPYIFSDDNDGFCRLLSVLASYDRNSPTICLESTAHYADNLVEFPVSKRYQVCVINPIQTSTMCKNNIQKTKTDKVDTLVIARTSISQPHRFFSQEDITSCTLRISAISGMSYINGGMILGKIGNIHRFQKPSQLLAFAGLDPSVYQSGNFNASYTRMSKPGSRVLRYALINAAHNVVRSNSTFKAYYNAKWPRAGRITTLLGIMPANLSGSSLRCLLTSWHSISSKF